MLVQNRPKQTSLSCMSSGCGQTQIQRAGGDQGLPFHLADHCTRPRCRCCTSKRCTKKLHWSVVRHLLPSSSELFLKVLCAFTSSFPVVEQPRGDPSIRKSWIGSCTDGLHCIFIRFPMDPSVSITTPFHRDHDTSTTNRRCEIAPWRKGSLGNTFLSPR